MCKRFDKYHVCQDADGNDADDADGSGDDCGVLFDWGPCNWELAPIVVQDSCSVMMITMMVVNEYDDKDDHNDDNDDGGE